MTTIESSMEIPNNNNKKTKLKIELLYDPVILLLGIYCKECKSGYHNDTCTPMFIAGLFTIVKLWK
jgi:hypothetical protein